jgi:polar amino acid transport system substrate-binding protein
LRADSPYRQAGDLQSPGMVIMGIAGTATLRSSEQAAAGAAVVGAATLPEATAAFTAGRCDALALGRLALDDLAARMPGTRVTEGNFHVAETAAIVPNGNPAALEAASELIRRMKEDGTVAASFRRHGMADAVIPPEP